MKVSILLCTYRSGGLDVSFSGLANQTFPRSDFEVILCDAMYKRRKDAVEDYLKIRKLDIPLLHVEPFRNQFPLDSGSKHRNSAIAYAEGELCIFLTDYAFVRPDFVQRHWDIYKKHNRRSCMAPHHYLQHPAIKETWREEPISIFFDEFAPDMIPLLKPQDGGQDPKLVHPDDGAVISPYFFHLKNESIPTETLLYINGCDEGYDTDGGHLYSDNDLALRCHKVGHEFVLDKTNVAEIIQVRDFYPTLQRNRSTEQDLQYFQSRIDSGFPPVNTEINMREIRSETLRQKKKERRKQL